MSKRPTILSKALAEEILRDCSKLTEYIMTRLRENPNYDIEIIARMLNTSRITLWRRLKECTTTFEELKKKAKEEAKERARIIEEKLRVKYERNFQFFILYS